MANGGGTYLFIINLPERMDITQRRACTRCYLTHNCNKYKSTTNNIYISITNNK